MLHEGIAKFNGYEINTEGDSFHIAFTSVAAAVQVAMETQTRLLDSDWPKDVLKLPACGQVTPSASCISHLSIILNQYAPSTTTLVLSGACLWDSSKPIRIVRVPEMNDKRGWAGGWSGRR